MKYNVFVQDVDDDTKFIKFSPTHAMSLAVYLCTFFGVEIREARLLALVLLTSDEYYHNGKDYMISELIDGNYSYSIKPSQIFRTPIEE